MNQFLDLKFLGSFLAQVLILQADNRSSKELLGFDLNGTQGSSVEMRFEPNGLSLVPLKINRNVD